MKSKDSNSKKSVSYQKKDGRMSYQKKDGRGHVRPSFFWYDNDKDLFSRDACHSVPLTLLALPLSSKSSRNKSATLCKVLLLVPY